MVNRVRFFAESYRLCALEFKSGGCQCAILGQLVGTTKIQDGCRDLDKLQNMFIFTLHHARNIIFVCTRILWRMGNSMEPFIIMSDYVPVITNKKWPPLSSTITKIKHKLIDFCYINDFIWSIPMFYHIRT